MDIREFLMDLKTNNRLCYVMFCGDPDLRPIYIKKFTDKWDGKIIYREDLPEGKQPRMIGKKPIYVIQDWEKGIKKPKQEYCNVTYPTLLVYTEKEPAQPVKTAYKDCLVVIPPVTGEQATRQMQKTGVPDNIITVLKDKTSSVQEAMLLGKQMVELASELRIDINTCFQTYYYRALEHRNADEEPTEFLHSILSGDYNYVFNYLLEQRGNELFVFGCILNWLEEIIRYCSCSGDYWNDANLVMAKVKDFKLKQVNKTPFLTWIRLYEKGLLLMQSIKINEPDPGSVLEVFVCYIIKTTM